MVLPGLCEERWRVRSPTSPKRPKLVLDLNVVPAESKEEEEEAFDDRGSEKKNRCSPLKKRLVLDLNDVVEEEEEARKSPSDDGGSREKKSKRSLLKRADGAVNLPKRRSDSSCKAPRAKLCVQLSREEIEEDFVKMTGRRLPRKPNKRPSVVRKQLDTLFPGLMLTEVTPDLYKVPELPVHQSRKRNNRNRKGKDV